MSDISDMTRADLSVTDMVPLTPRPAKKVFRNKIPKPTSLECLFYCKNCISQNVELYRSVRYTYILMCHEALRLRFVRQELGWRQYIDPT